MTEEAWTDLPGWEGYQISNLGRIIGRRGKVIQGSIDRDGYNVISLGTRTPQVRTLKIHRLVFELFVGPIPVDRVINHKNGIKNDNRLDNLEVVSISENVQHAVDHLGAIFGRHGKNRRGKDHPGSVLTEEQVREIRRRHAQGVSGYKLAREYPVSQFAIQSIIHRRTWAHLD